MRMENYPQNIDLNSSIQQADNKVQLKEKLRLLMEKYAMSKDKKNVNVCHKSEIENQLFNKSFTMPLEFVALPDIELFSSGEENCTEKKYPQLIDLCYEDKLRISRLIEEITKCKERNMEDTKAITNLQSEKLKMTVDISKLEKEITRLLSDCEDKENEITQINKKLVTVTQDFKNQLTELELKMDVTEKKMADELRDQQNKNKELSILVNKLNNDNKELTSKYECKKKKLSRALSLIKNMIKRPNNNKAITKEDKYCQISPTSNSNANTKMLSPAENERATRNTVQNTTDQQLLSELFFQVTSNKCFEETDPFMFLIQDSYTLNSKNKKYF